MTHQESCGVKELWRERKIRGAFYSEGTDFQGLETVFILWRGLRNWVGGAGGVGGAKA